MKIKTDFRALCSELVDELEDWIAYGDEADIADAHTMVDRAKAALAQPEPQGPGDEDPVIDLSEVADLCAWLRANSSGIYRPAARAADLLKQLTQCRTARQH